MLDFNKTDVKGFCLSNKIINKKGSANPEIVSEIIENVLPIALDAGVKIVSMIFNKRKEWLLYLILLSTIIQKIQDFLIIT